jgi:hypothetical protein
MQRYYVGLLALGLAGCATAMDVGLPDGSTGYSLNCSGQANWGQTWGACMKKAAEVCKGRGYDILARDQNSGRVTTVTANEYGAWGSSTMMTEREMIVRCK